MQVQYNDEEPSDETVQDTEPVPVIFEYSACDVGMLDKDAEELGGGDSRDGPVGGGGSGHDEVDGDQDDIWVHEIVCFPHVVGASEGCRSLSIDIQVFVSLVETDRLATIYSTYSSAR